MKTTPITPALEELLADPKTESRHPGSPSFIFFDDIGTRLSPEERKFLKDLEDFEDWKAAREHAEAISSRAETYAMERTRIVEPPKPFQPIPANNADKVVKPPSKRDRRRASYLVRHEEEKPSCFKEIEDSYNPVEKEVIYTVRPLLNYDKILEARIAKTPEPKPIWGPKRSLPYSEYMEEKRRAKWLINHYARQAKATNADHWRKLILPLIDHVDDPVIGKDVVTILKGLREAIPFAPRAVSGTTFINPDKSKITTAGTSPYTAKTAYCKKHGLKDDEVSMDRVQYENENTSRWVIGKRRQSNMAPSRYYDPEPRFIERFLKDGELERGYDPTQAINLLMLDPTHPVIPMGAHRLTIREVEQAIIAGAILNEDEEEMFANQLAENTMPEDIRVRMLDIGDGKEGIEPSGLSHEEEYVRQVLNSFGFERAAELLLFRDIQSISSMFHVNGRLTMEAIEMLQWVAMDDKARDDGDNMVGVFSQIISPPEFDSQKISKKDLPFIPHVNDYWRLNLDLLANDVTNERGELVEKKVPAYLRWKDS